MSTVLVIHDVEDHDTWKVAFDAAAPLRRAAGERSFRVLRAGEDGNRVVHLAEWSSLAASRAFFESDAVRAIRERAGVHEPRFLYLEESDRGTL